MIPSWRRVIRALALPLGLALFAIAAVNTDIESLAGTIRHIAWGLPLLLLPGAAWHLARTLAWQRCFPERLPFWRLFRVRLAAEAFSFVTVRGVAGEPLKVALLESSADATTATAAVALERIAYIAVTGAIVFAASTGALAALPLSATWLRVFIAMAAVSGASTGALLWLLFRPPSHHPVGHRRRGIAAFIAAVDAQVRELVHGDRSRLYTIVALEAFAYVAMAAEVWAALRAAGQTPTVLTSFAIETFTRAASMASAFIPANLGALEASNVVAVAMVSAGGGAALAVIRRLRGLFWCAAGFACYPPRARAHASQTSRTTLAVADDPHATVPITATLGGLPLGERIALAAARSGYGRLLVLSTQQRREWSVIAARVKGSIETVVMHDEDAWRARLDSEHADVATSSTMPGPDGPLAIGTYDELRAAEQRLRASIVKPTDGRVGRFNRRMSIPISVALIRSTRCSANTLSVALIALGLWAGWLFSHGTYAMGVAGALVSLAASILDGCDGELARLQYQESAFGVWLDTIGDYAYYIAVFAGLTVGAVGQTQSGAFWWIGGALIAGSVATFALLILLRSRITGGRPERLRRTTQSHFEQRARWTRLAARLSTVATRATMPYGVLAFALVGALPALVALAAFGAQVYWISLSIELGRLLSSAPTQSHNYSDLAHDS